MTEKQEEMRRNGKVILLKRESERGNEIARVMEREKESGWKSGAAVTG